MAENGQSEDRKRSPLYPSIGLEEAVEKARTLYEQDKGAAGTLDVLAEHWGTTTKSSSFLQGVASLKRYGLLVELPGTPRKLKLSKDALDIVLLPETDHRHVSALKRAAVAPQAFRELWNEHGSDLPSDQNLRHHLITAKNFLPAAAADLIKQYKKTITYAGLEKGDKIPNDPPEGTAPAAGSAPVGSIFDVGFGQQPSGERMTPASNLHNPAGEPIKEAAPPPPAGHKGFPIYLTKNQQGAMHVPASMTPQDYLLLKTQIESSLAIIGATFVDPPVDPKTGKPATSEPTN